MLRNEYENAFSQQTEIKNKKKKQQTEIKAWICQGIVTTGRGRWSLRIDIIQKKISVFTSLNTEVTPSWGLLSKF